MLSMRINHVVDVQYPLQCVCVCDKQKQTCSVISFWYRCHTIRVLSFLWGQPRRKACDGAVDEASRRRTFRLYAWYCPASFLSFSSSPCGCCCICPKVKGIHWILRQTSKQFVRCNQPVAFGICVEQRIGEQWRLCDCHHSPVQVKQKLCYVAYDPEAEKRLVKRIVA